MVLNRIRLLRLFNRDMEIHGLYGGPEGDFSSFEKEVGPELDSLACLRGKSPEWKWKNVDFALQEWFLGRGRDIGFDMLHVVEWDMLCLDSLDRIFRDVPAGALGLAGIRPAREAGDNWIWMTRDPYREEYEKLRDDVRTRFGHEEEPCACVACVACVPRSFLEEYSRLEIEELCNDEVRVALFAHAMGYETVDTGLYDWERSGRAQFFSLEERVIPESAIFSELRKKGGQRVFHPVRTVFSRFDDRGGAAQAGYLLEEFLRNLRS